ncbi:MAG: glycosyltransferase family 2 protein [Clostridiaceae bacterium]|nr:glycosyltransferase family 2 protein [Clostridiaceae bacterium]
MTEDFVTVIMPVYNGEAYLKKSIGSVFAQTWHSIELIAVNDGSKDHSQQVLQELQEKAPKNVSMRVILQENAGICEARNRALEQAEGRYIAFIDQDDFMNPDCIETLVKTIRREAADVVIGGFDLVDSKGTVLECWELNPAQEWSKYRISAPWGRLFDKRVIDANGLRFMQTKISEDLYFNFLFFSYAKKICVTRYRGYQWQYRKTSESHANMSRFAEDRNPLSMMTQLLGAMKTPNSLKPEYFEYFMIKHIVWYLFFVAKSADREQLKEVYSQCFSWLKKYFPEYRKNKLLHLRTPEGEQLKIRLVVFLAMKLHRYRMLFAVLNLYRKL